MTYSMRKTLKLTLPSITLLLSIAAITISPAGNAKQSTSMGNITKQRMLNADGDYDNWMSYGRTYGDQRFSPLKDVNAANVDQLGLSWYTDIPSKDGLSATPIVVDGVIYLGAPRSNVFAIEARTGKLLWSYDPKVKLGHNISSSWNFRINRGVAVWEGKVFVATADCRLIALNASNGKEVWTASRETSGSHCDPEKEASMDGAPRVANGKVYIGGGVSDFGHRGVIAAYDANTGKEIWRFYTVPGDPKNGFENEAMAMASKTWSHGWAREGGAAVWETIVYDKELNTIYFGTDAGGSLNPEIRSPGKGDNLFTNSIVAVDADTGKYKWHYQVVPRDAWDYNANMPIILADLEIDGKKRKVLMQAPKSGFFYVIDRVTGKLISAENYVPVNWASHYDTKTGRPVELPGARYYQNKNGQALLYPSVWGGHNWQPMSYSPLTGLVYFSAWDIPALYEYKEGATLGGILVDSYVMGWDEETLRSRGSLVAWDPVRQNARWKIPQRVPVNGGTLATAGNLVFHGTGSGEIKAYSADEGQVLWSQKTGSSIQTAPITYRIDGKQMILAIAGAPAMIRGAMPDFGATRDARGPARLMAFEIGGNKPMPEAKSEQQTIPKPPKQFASESTIKDGEELYNAGGCWLCHGERARGFGGSAPDLRGSPFLNTAEGWYQVVVKGAKQSNGMLGEPSFSKDDSETLRAFVIKSASEEYQFQQKNR